MALSQVGGNTTKVAVDPPAAAAAGTEKSAVAVGEIDAGPVAWDQGALEVHVARIAGVSYSRSAAAAVVDDSTNLDAHIQGSERRR